MATHYRGTAAEERALDAYVKLERAGESVRSVLYRGLEADGVTESQFGVLEILLHLGPLCPGDISRKLFRSGGNVTVVLDNLARRGFVERRPDPKDRRRVGVRLTKEGRATIRRLFPRHLERIVASFSALTAEEQDSLARLCRKLGLSLRA